MCVLGSGTTLSSGERARARHYHSLRASEEIGRCVTPLTYGRNANVRLRNGLIDEITISEMGEGARLVTSVATAAVCGYNETRCVRELNVVGCLPGGHEETRRWKLNGEHVRIEEVSASYRFEPYSL